MGWLEHTITPLEIVACLIGLACSIGFIYWLGCRSVKQDIENECNIATADDEIRKAGGKV